MPSCLAHWAHVPTLAYAKIPVFQVTARVMYFAHVPQDRKGRDWMRGLRADTMNERVLENNRERVYMVIY